MSRSFVGTSFLKERPDVLRDFLRQLDDYYLRGRTSDEEVIRLLRRDLKSVFPAGREQLIWQYNHKCYTEKIAFELIHDVQHLGFEPKNLSDIGCNDGNMICVIAKNLNIPIHRAIGVDIKPIKTEANFRKVTYDGTDLSVILNDSQDLITMVYVLHHAQDPQRLLRESFRILRQRGCLIIREHDAEGRSFILYHRVMDRMLTKVFPEQEQPDMYCGENFARAGRWVELAQSIGFRTLEIRHDADGSDSFFTAILTK